MLASSPTSGPSPSLLLVEDEAVLRCALGRFLEQRGASVARASCLAEARARLRERCFDALILDLGLPDGDGLGLVTPERAPCTLVITARPEPERLARHGVRHVLTKPFDLRRAAEAVDGILEAKRDGASLAPGGTRLLIESRGGAARRPRIALYSHDTMGLGHFRRNLAIARTLADAPLHASVLLIGGAQEASAFRMPPRVECLALPSFYKESNGRYRARSLALPVEQLVALRAASIRAALAAFAPELLIVDKAPWGALHELEPTLRDLAERPDADCILGLRDILDDPAATRAEWRREDHARALRELYREIWIYGDRRVYDPLAEYPELGRFADRVRFTGYLGRPARANGREPGALPLPAEESRLILCLVGGGQDGAPLARAFLRAELPAGCEGWLVAGPHMPASDFEALEDRARADARRRVIRFTPDLEPLVARAARIVCMGGYNTLVEGLSAGKPLLVVPRSTPRREQRIRAERLAALGLVDWLDCDALNAESLSRWLAAPVRAPRAEGCIDLGGLAWVSSRVTQLLGLGLAGRPRGSSYEVSL